MATNFIINNGWLEKKLVNASHLTSALTPTVSKHNSTHCDERECDDISLLVIHNISLPPGEFGSNHITDLFMGCLNPAEHEYFEHIYQVRVSAHCLIRRDGNVEQYVPFDKRAWHAGVSEFEGREKCNDFSIGIEMEGTDDIPYTDEQYQTLQKVTAAIINEYPLITLDRVTGHSDIAPGRKTDPGQSFDWQKYKSNIEN